MAVSSLEQQITDLQASNNQLVAQLDALREQHKAASGFQQEAFNARETIAALQRDNEILEGRLAQARTSISELRSSLETCESSRIASTAAVTAANDLVRSLRTLLA